MDRLPKDEDLIRLKQEEPLIRETAEQVIKDFRLFEMEVFFTGKAGTPYEELSEQVLPYIRMMLSSDTSSLFSLLYQVDIPDHWWEKIRKESDPDSIALAITEAILQRELLKVLTRNHFRQRRLESED